MFPRTIRPGLDTEVYVNILQAYGPTTVTATLQDDKNNTVITSSKEIKKGMPDTVQLKVLIFFLVTCEVSIADNVYHVEAFVQYTY